MTKETMTIHKALSDLKTLDKRIDDVISKTVFCVANKHSNEKINGVKVNDYTKMMLSNYDKLVDLLARRDALKNAVSLSNAVTKVKIDNIEYSIAEAINMKNHGIELKTKMLRAMERDYQKAIDAIAVYNGDSLEERADQYVIGIYGSKDGKTNSDDIAKIRKDFITSQSYELVDPIDIVDAINTLKTDIDDFSSEVDAAISVSNAITTITIEY